MIPYNPQISEPNKFPINNPNPDDPDTPVWVTYEEFVCNLIKEMGSHAANIHHMGTGLGGEGGEILDATKKVWVYGKELDRDNAIEELGDIEFYAAGLRQMIGVTRHEVLAYNTRKLQARYKGSYSDAAAQERADKLQVIDVTSPKYIAENPPISKEQVAAVDEQAGINHTTDMPAVAPEIQDWCLPLLAAYHAGKTVQAIDYTKNTATVLFVGDSNPHKLYRPRDEV